MVVVQVPPEAANFSLKTVSGELCCVALPFSASLGVMVHTCTGRTQTTPVWSEGREGGSEGGTAASSSLHPTPIPSAGIHSLYLERGGREGGRGGREGGRGGRVGEGGRWGREIMEIHVQQILVPLQGASWYM